MTTIDERLWDEIQHVLAPKFRPSRLPQKMGVIDANVSVWLVDGNQIKLWERKGAHRAKSNRGDEDFMDFTEGGNGLEDPGLCGERQIFVDAKIDPNDWAFVCYHEAVERRDMLKGMKYEAAHERANAAEKVLRLRSQPMTAPLNHQPQ